MDGGLFGVRPFVAGASKVENELDVTGLKEAGIDGVESLDELLNESVFEIVGAIGKHLIDLDLGGFIFRSCVIEHFHLVIGKL